MSAPFRIVAYDRSAHGDGPWHVVKTVFDEYGFPFDENDYDADVLHPDVYYSGERNAFMVAEIDGTVVGCVGLTDEGEGVFELHRLYVIAGTRKHRLGQALVQLVIDAVRKRGGHRIVLFSDIAFDDAHRLYTRMGFRCNRFRYAPDPWQSREWGFVLDLA